MIQKIKNTLKDSGGFVLIKKARRFLFRKFFYLIPSYFRKFFAFGIKKFQSDNPEIVLDYAFNVLGLVLRPIQIKEEFLGFLKEFKELSPKNILEIGTATGGSLLSVCKLAPDNAKIISIDLPGGKFGGGYPEWKTPIFKMFKKNNQELILLRSDSHLEETKDKIINILEGDKIDFLFIDGDHEYEGVKKDFEMYSPLVRSGGVIAFHDIAPNGDRQYTGGVPIFWKEIKDSYKIKEFIKDENQRGFGIGLIFV